MNDFKSKKRAYFIVLGGLLVAMDVLCARFLYFWTPGQIDRISLQFVPNALAGLLLGPVWGMLVCAVGDVAGMLVNSAGMTFMPLITLACAMRGLIYGLILHNRNGSIRITPLRCVAAAAAVTLIVELGAMPAFLSILYGRAWFAVLAGKLITRALTIPVYGALLYGIIRALARANIPAFSGVVAGSGRRKTAKEKA